MQVKIQLMHKINKFIWRFLLCIKFKKRKIIEEWIGMDIDVAPSQRTSESRNIYWFQIQNDNFSALALFQVYTYTHLFHPRFKCGMIVPQKKCSQGNFQILLSGATKGQRQDARRSIEGARVAGYCLDPCTLSSMISLLVD